MIHTGLCIKCKNRNGKICLVSDNNSVWKARGLKGKCGIGAKLYRHFNKWERFCIWFCKVRGV